MHTGGCVLLKISCSVCPARARSSFPVFGSATLFATCVCWPSNTGYWPSLGWRSGNADSSRDRAVIDSSRLELLPFPLKLTFWYEFFKIFVFNSFFLPLDCFSLGFFIFEQFSLIYYLFSLIYYYYYLLSFESFLFQSLWSFFLLAYLFPKFLSWPLFVFNISFHGYLFWDCFESIVFYSDEDNLLI